MFRSGLGKSLYLLLVMLIAGAAPARADWTLFVSAGGNAGNDGPGVLRFNGITGAPSSSFNNVGLSESVEGIAVGSSSLWVANNVLGGMVLSQLDAQSGTLLNSYDESLSQVSAPEGMIFGADGNLDVASNAIPGQGGLTGIVRINPANGSVVSNLATSTTSPVMTATYAMAIKNTSLYLTGDNLFGNSPNDVQRYSATTGAYLGEFVPPGANGLSDATGLAFDSLGNLYVANAGGNDVLEFGSGGQYEGQFVTPASGGLSDPLDLAFGPNGDLFVLDSTAVLEYSAATGAFVGTFASVSGENPQFMLFANTPEPGTAALGLMLLTAAVRRRPG
jgi:hypothetical protein